MREGASLSIGRPLRRFRHGYLGYSYEVLQIAISRDLLKATSGSSLYGMPLFSFGLDSGRHTDSRIMPALSYNTVDQPLFPRSGLRLTLSGSLASEQLGGSYNYAKPEGEAVFYLPISRRTSLGVRAQGGWLRRYGTTRNGITCALPRRETQIRGGHPLSRPGRPVHHFPRRQQVHAVQRRV